MLRTDEHGKGSQKDMFESPTSVDQIINSRRLGTTRELARQAFDAYSPGVQKVYANYSDPRTEPVLLEWGLFHYNFTCVFFFSGLPPGLLRLHAIGRLRSCKGQNKRAAG